MKKSSVAACMIIPFLLGVILTITAFVLMVGPQRISVLVSAETSSAGTSEKEPSAKATSVQEDDALNHPDIIRLSEINKNRSNISQIIRKKRKKIRSRESRIATLKRFYALEKENRPNSESLSDLYSRTKRLVSECDSFRDEVKRLQEIDERLRRVAQKLRRDELLDTVDRQEAAEAIARGKALIDRNPELADSGAGIDYLGNRREDRDKFMRTE